MNRWLKALILLMISGIAMPAAAQESNVYYGIGISDGGLQVPGNSPRNLGTLAVSVGTQLSDRVGIELALGAGSDDASSIFTESLVQYQAGLLRLSHSWANKQVYLLLGHARLDVDSRLNPVNAGNAFGVGINLFGTKNTAINAHYLSLAGGEFTSAVIGIQYFIGGVR